jgi:hypothetical protein
MDWSRLIMTNTQQDLATLLEEIEKASKGESEKETPLKIEQ